MENHECKQILTFDTIKEELKSIKQKQDEQAAAISGIRQEQAETRIYVRQIFDRIDDIKILFNTTYTNLANLFTEGNKTTNKNYSGIIMELIKTIVTIAGLVAAIKIAT